MEFLALLAVLERLGLLPVPFVEFPEFAEFVVRFEAERGRGEGDARERDPAVAAERRGFGFLGDERELLERGFILFACQRGVHGQDAGETYLERAGERVHNLLGALLVVEEDLLPLFGGTKRFEGTFRGHCGR